MNIYELGLLIERDLLFPKRIAMKEKDVTVNYLAEVHGHDPIAAELPNVTDEQKTILLECFNIIVKSETIDGCINAGWTCSWFKSQKKFKRKSKYQEEYEKLRAESVLKENEKTIDKDFIECLTFMTEIESMKGWGYDIRLSTCQEKEGDPFITLIAKLINTGDKYGENFTITNTSLNLPEIKENLAATYNIVCAEKAEELRLSALKSRALSKLTKEDKEILGLKE